MVRNGLLQTLIEKIRYGIQFYYYSNQGSRYRSQISQIAKEKKKWRKKYAFGDTKWRLKKSLAKDTFSR